MIVQKYVDYQSCINILFSMSIVDAPIESTQNILNCIQNSDYEQNIQQLGYAQICRVWLWYESKNDQKLVLDQNIQNLCLKAAQQEAQKMIYIPNNFIDIVFLMVQKQYYFARKRVQILGGLLAIHIEVRQGEKAVAVQACTHRCYAGWPDYQMLGSTRSFHRLLGNFGWQVVEVSPFQWSQKNLLKANIVINRKWIDFVNIVLITIFLF
eukprot:TRINITY_DN4032_c0_g1_i1.p3 TRINITY_DN4032_c0_g1~~TRINITY_DN4032_c0_g1_i1.p3  ORF type:complete len:229 (-),score=10.57 TRINITY_DN4032_c0_g1_i1:408-1037(-)